jgi:hypothetical protein
MSGLKLTEWYSGDQKPVRAGIYERLYEGEGIAKCYWDGKYFFGGAYTNEEAIVNAFIFGPSFSQSLSWRGVAK